MSNVDPVRVSRFEWERLMMMSDLPKEDRFKLLALGIFMDADGRNARPGNANLARFGYHEETWKQLLRRVVKAGWLIQVARGGARRGRGGTTIRRASVYAASAPREVWKRRQEVLDSPSFRAPSVEGSVEPDPVKEAPDAPFAELAALKEAVQAAAGDPDVLKEALRGAPDWLKEALAASFNGSGDSLKEASGHFVPESLKEASDSFEGSISGFEGSLQTLPHHAVTTTHLPPSRPPAEPSTPADPTSGREGGRQLTPEEQEAADALTHAIAAEPRLTLGEPELVALLPLVTPWLDRATPDHLRQALTAGLPATVDSPAGLLRQRLTRKLPAARAVEPSTTIAAPKCDECDANGLRYHDPEDQLGPYRCPCRTSQPDAA